MAYFFFSGSSRGLPTGVTVTLTEPLSIEVELATPVITVGTVLKLPAIEVEVELVLPSISRGVDLSLSPIEITVELIMPYISLGSDARAWWYYNMINGD